jgi:hypothetical protein
MNEAMTDEAPASCANCSKAECGESNLETCGACKLVKYCNKDCQIAHRQHHESACKKREAELYDEALFSEPPKRGCPLCYEMLPSLMSGQGFRACCGQIICSGCCYAHDLQSNGRATCPFCRADKPSAKEYIMLLNKRADTNDANAMCALGDIYFNGKDDLSVKKDREKAVKLYRRAAELGYPSAYNQLGYMYYHGDNVVKDKKQAKQCFEKGAIEGCVYSRYSLGVVEFDEGSFDRATKYWLIAARCGDIRGVYAIRDAMTEGKATRDHYAQALRGYDRYSKKVRTDLRDRAAAYSDAYRYL